MSCGLVLCNKSECACDAERLEGTEHSFQKTDKNVACTALQGERVPCESECVCESESERERERGCVFLLGCSG